MVEKQDGSSEGSDTPGNEKKQNIIIPIPSYKLDNIDDTNSPLQNVREGQWDERLILSLSDSNMSNREHQLTSTEDRQISVEQKNVISTFVNDKSNVESQLGAENNRELNKWENKIISPVPNNALKGREVSDWNEKVVKPISYYEHGSTGTDVSAEQITEVEQGKQKVIMPVHYDSMNNEGNQSPVVSKWSEYTFQSPGATSFKTEGKEQLTGETKENELHRIKTENITPAQATNEYIENYDEELKRTDKVLHGVLKDNGIPHEVSPSDRKQLFGDHRTTVLSLSEIEQQTENIKKYLTRKQEEIPPKVEVGKEDIPGKKSPAPVNHILQSEMETRKQKIASDIKQQQLTERKIMKKPMGFKSLKKEAKTMVGKSESKKLDSSVTIDKYVDNTPVKKEVSSKSGEQISHLKENIQKTPLVKYLYNKQYKDSADHRQSYAKKTGKNMSQNLHPSHRDHAEKASPLDTKQPHNISAVQRRNDEIQTVKPSEFLEKKKKRTWYNSITEKSSATLTESANKADISPTQNLSSQKDTGVKYVVSGGKRDNEIKKQILENDIKKKATDQRGPKSEIRDVKKSSTDEASFQKEQPGRVVDDNIHAIEKYVKKEISSVSPEKVKGSMTQLKKGGDSQTGKDSKMNLSNTKAEAEEKKKARKHSQALKEDNLKNKKFPEINRGKDGTVNPIKGDPVTEQQKKPHEQGSPPKTVSSTETEKPGMHLSTIGKGSKGNSEMAEQTFLEKYHRFSKDANAGTTQPQKSNHSNVTDFVSRYSVTDARDLKLDNHEDQQKGTNYQSSLASKTASNLLESSDTSGITSQSIILQDMPPKYMLKGIKENEMTKTAGGELHPRNTANIVWPIHQLSTVNKKYLGKPVRASSWRDAGTFLPWVSFGAQKKNDQNTINTEKAAVHKSHQTNGNGFGSQFWQFLGQQYAVFKENFNNHTVRGRANVAKATLLTVGLFAMWQIFKPKGRNPSYQRCSECGSVNNVENTH